MGQAIPWPRDSAPRGEISAMVRREGTACEACRDERMRRADNRRGHDEETRLRWKPRADVWYK